jgi:hypothetical protein
VRVRHRHATTRWLASALAVGLAVLTMQALGIAPAAATTIPRGSVHALNKLSPVNTQAAKSFSVDCGPGERVLGGGAFTVGGVHAVITELQPIHTATKDSFKVSAAADQFGIAVAWNFQVFAFCAVVPASAGLEIVPKTNLPTSSGTDQALAQCQGGKRLVGGGGRIANGNGQVDLGITTSSSGPFVFGAAGFGKEDADGYAGTWTVTGYAVCALPQVFDDLQQLKGTSVVTSGQSVNLTCPSGLSLTGLGGSTSAPGTHLQRIIPTTVNGPITGRFGIQSSAPTGSTTLESIVFCAR